MQKDTWNVTPDKFSPTLAQLLEMSVSHARDYGMRGGEVYCFALGEAIVHLQKAGLSVNDALVKGLLATQVYCAAHPEDFKIDDTTYHPPL